MFLKHELDYVAPRYRNVLKRHGIEQLEMFPWVKGNFTVVLVSHDGILFIGIAKRNNIDKPNESIGVRIALNRAVKDLIKLLERDGLQTIQRYSRTVNGFSKEESTGAAH